MDELLGDLPDRQDVMGSSIASYSAHRARVAAELGHRLHALSHTPRVLAAPTPSDPRFFGRSRTGRYLQCRRRGFRAFRRWRPEPFNSTTVRDGRK